MKYRTLGRTGLKVSVVGLGTWQLGGEWGKTFTQAEVDAILDKAAEAGVNLIDTAECYGDHAAERLVGDYLSRHERDRWIVATKFGHRFNGFMDRTDAFGAEEVRAQLIASLRALRTDRIDLYQFHSGSDQAFLDDGLRSFLDEARRAGMVRNLGLSLRSAGSESQVREAFTRGYGVLQVVYNRLDNRAESGVFPTARRYNLGVLARVPLASGLLGGRHDARDKFGPDDYRSTLGRDEIARRVREGERIAERELPLGVSRVRWALAWCLRDPVVTAVIPGVKSPEQMAEDASAADLLAVKMP
ncbi:MAG TPA: aldo/keto reductase [Candidatus Aminicenantes bacterium]|nr:aldo/keto reductase [Candidatus Aminicenantes bacterium]HRY65769.1 aldo/keto reductase [Candidatus Aminicenantes bacterium]HRZ72683.1 aldo/keto reductase [Candidatus Aminicenantes bacterium]